jgi:hypothetical protein
MCYCHKRVCTILSFKIWNLMWQLILCVHLTVSRYLVRYYFQLYLVRVFPEKYSICTNGMSKDNPPFPVWMRRQHTIKGLLKQSEKWKGGGANWNIICPTLRYWSTRFSGLHIPGLPSHTLGTLWPQDHCFSGFLVRSTFPINRYKAVPWPSSAFG